MSVPYIVQRGIHRIIDWLSGWTTSDATSDAISDADYEEMWRLANIRNFPYMPRANQVPVPVSIDDGDAGDDGDVGMMPAGPHLNHWLL